MTGHLTSPVSPFSPMRDYAAIRRVLIITMLFNFAATAVKLAAGLATGALSLVADGLDSFFDGLSNVVGLVGIQVGSRPPDANHPYGHRKFETLAALIIASLLFVACWELAKTAVERLFDPQPITVNIWTFSALVISIVIQALTSLYELGRGRQLKSEILLADALHTRASILSSLAVMGGLAAVWLGYPAADSILTLVVAALIAKIGIDIIRENTPALVDQAVVDERVVAQVVEGVPGVESYHRIRSRGHVDAGALDLHIRVAPELSMQKANAIADEVRRRLLDLDNVSDVTVHVEAQTRPGYEADTIGAVVQQAANELGLQLHEFWVHQVNNSLILELHVGVAPTLSVGKAHALVDQLEKRCLERLPNVTECQSHIELHTPEILPGAAVSRGLEARVAAAIAAAVAETPILRDAHNLSVRQSEGRLITSFEVVASADLPISAAHELTSELELRLRAVMPDLGEVLIHVEPFDHTAVENKPAQDLT
ncbi:MAG: cation diffusion facilitator family transporter [Caldilineales bacterium]|nr:cation diffusion facilitator family transporter [Caldilineales bacterium]